jgi:hypothetical protein
MQHGRSGFIDCSDSRIYKSFCVMLFLCTGLSAHSGEFHIDKDRIISIHAWVGDLTDQTALLRCPLFLQTRSNVNEQVASEVVALIQAERLRRDQVSIGV